MVVVVIEIRLCYNSRKRMDRGGNEMQGKEKIFNLRTTLQVIGVMIALLLAATLLWHGNATSNQAIPALLAQVYFDGEYRIADGPWEKIVAGEHIPSTIGDVTLRGNFHMRAPDGEYVGIYRGDMPIAFFTNHISLIFYEEGSEPHVVDMENPLFGASACGVAWTAYSFTSAEEAQIEILIHNPHNFGNETAIDEMLANISLWSGIDFEKGVLDGDQAQRNMGLFFAIVSLAFLGIALFATLIHNKNSRNFWLFGLAILFAGIYLTYSTDGISFWSESIVTNTTILGISMMFYMLFLSLAVVHFLKATKTVGTITVVALGAADVLFFVLPMLTKMLFYDTWRYWTVAQSMAGGILFGCLVKEFYSSKTKERWLYIGFLLPLLSFGVDAIMIDIGFWKIGIASVCSFLLLFIAAMIVVLRIVPHSINVLAKARELETERVRLNAQLSESRISTMMSQIRPHFIYNTLGSIEQLCNFDPPKAGELVHNFAKYLRGNFGELDNPKPIWISQEMEHVRYYTSIEKVRFPDMTFSFEMNADDFQIPALTIQPIVENAIKHGLMKLEKGGTIQVVSYETETHYCVTVTDDGVGFDTSVLQDERKHVGIRNIRGRLEAMVGGTLEIESAVGIGTKVLITIPKEGHK